MPGPVKQHQAAAALVRHPGGPQRATLLELLFDLVFVAAIALSSTTLAGDVSWHGVVRVLLPLMAVWWVWSITALFTDFYDPQRPRIQVVIVSAMLGSMLLAGSIPDALGDRALVFAGTYVAVHIGRGIILVASLGGTAAQARAARFAIWFAVSGVAWIGGALVGERLRALLWALALLVDYVSAGFRYPVPWLGRVPLDQYGKAGEHLGERYQQFMILALGDLILVPTIKYSQTEPTAARTTAFLVTFAKALLLWQIYVYRAGSVLLTVANRRPGRVVRWAPYTHVLMVAGIVATAAGSDLVVGRPTGRTPTGWVALIAGGSMLFLIGRTTFEYEVYSRVSWTRFAFMGVLVGISPVLKLLPPFLVAIAVATVLAGIAVTDTVRADRTSHHAPEAAEPPAEGSSAQP
jgi:low temperature requirement protein LtrA